MRKFYEEKQKATKYRKQSQRQKRIKLTVSEKHHLPPRKKSGKAKKHEVESFLLMDENSVLLPGKTDTAGRKEKKQRGILTSSLKDLLYKAYMQKCERSATCLTGSLQPFYITEAKPSDRNTCACYQHENMSLLIDSLAKRGLIPTKPFCTPFSYNM